jgi:HEAT repeats
VHHRAGTPLPLIAGLVLFSYASAPMPLRARIQLPPFTFDLTEFTSTAPLIFRGRVLETSARPHSRTSSSAIARFRVDRWYRGGSDVVTSLHFKPYNIPPPTNGGGCIDFTPGSYWLIFANEKSGQVELVDGCYGALTVSPLLAPTVSDNSVIAQMEADFVAGLDDSNPAGRVISIQRLGGLRSKGSRPALHLVIDNGNAVETKWAVWAALRTGDTTVLANLRDLLIASGNEDPMPYVPFELRRLKDRSATTGLIEIANTAAQADARAAAISVLGEGIKAPESLPTMASHLADPDPHVRYEALNGMRLLTNEPACTLPMMPRWTEDMVEPQIRRCLIWWEAVGKMRFQ